MSDDRRPATRPPGSVAVAGSVVSVLLALAGCSSSGPDPVPPQTTAATAVPSSPTTAARHSLGAGEGSLNLIAWAGYAEDGSTDKTVDWVTPFTDASGCQVTVKTARSSDEMVRLTKSGLYDGVSASGDISLRLIQDGDVAAVNTALVPNYATVTSFLKNRSWNSSGGRMYGIPHGWGANLLMSRADTVTPPPDSWGAVFDPASPYQGKVTAYDSPIYIADAALYLRTAKPQLRITDPYELDDAQFAAAVDLLRQQHELVGTYWSHYTDEVGAFESGRSMIGTSWQVIATLIDAGGKAKVNAVVPREGATGWSDTWMVSSRAKHPNCMYRWLDWIVSPSVNAQAAEWFGQAPAQAEACSKTTDKNFCATYHATDAAYARRISYWTTPVRDCGDSRGIVCKDYSAWARAWSTIKR